MKYTFRIHRRTYQRTIADVLVGGSAYFFQKRASAAKSGSSVEASFTAVNVP